MIDEIVKYGCPTSDSDLMTVKYLKALNQLFERGILCSEHVSNEDSVVLQNMGKGFKFFKEWSEDVVSHGEYSH